MTEPIDPAEREAEPGEALPEVDQSAYGPDAVPLETARSALMRSIVAARVRLRGVDAALAEIEELSIKTPGSEGQGR